MILKVDFKEVETYTPVDFNEVDDILLTNLDDQVTINNETPLYGGPYEVVPSDKEQTLLTSQRLLTDNILIHAAPVAKAEVIGTLLELTGSFPIELL